MACREEGEEGGEEGEEGGEEGEEGGGGGEEGCDGTTVAIAGAGPCSVPTAAHPAVRAQQVGRGGGMREVEGRGKGGWCNLTGPHSSQMSHVYTAPEE